MHNIVFPLFEEKLIFVESKRRKVMELIREFQQNTLQGARIIKVMDQAEKTGIPMIEFLYYIDNLMKEGLIYKSSSDHVRTTRF